MNDNERIKIVEGFKAEVTLLSEKVVIVDLSKISTKEWRVVIDPKQTAVDEAVTLGKTIGMTAEELLALSQPDYRLVAAAF